MIRYTACVLMAFLLGTLTSAAQSKSSYTGTINVNSVRVLQAGKTLYVEMDIVLDHVKVKSAGAVDIIHFHVKRFPRLYHSYRIDINSSGIRGF